MLSEEQARKTIQADSIFHSTWSSKCETWFQMWRDIHSEEPTSLLNVGVGPPGGNSTARWVSFFRKMFPSIKHVEHLELDKNNADKSDVGQKITLGDIKEAHLLFPSKNFDILFWCQGPEHIHRDEWEETFNNIQKICHVLIMQCPWGSGYDYDSYHYSKNIRKGEFEPYDFTVLYNGKVDSKDAGIIAYKRSK